MTQIKHPHPGIQLKRHLILHRLMWTDFADRIEVDDRVIAAILNQTGTITPSLAIKFSRFFRCEIDFWLKLQINYELSLVVYETSYAKQLEVDPMQFPLPDRFG